jgi:hypothetical protein
MTRLSGDLRGEQMARDGGQHGRRWASDTVGREREEWRQLRTSSVGAFRAWARGSAARRRVARHVAPGGDGALTHGPRRRKEETDRWDPAAEIFLN